MTEQPSFSSCFPADRVMRWGVWSPDDQECWLPVMEQLYDQHWKCSSTSSPSRDDVESENRSIPQILHFIWLGEDFPPEFASLQQRWAEMHPGWEIKLWGDDEIRLLVLENQAAFDDVHNYGGKSDIARYEILHKWGGVYIDSDFACVEAITDMCSCLDFFCGISSTGTLELNNGLIGASPRHPILRAVIDEIRESHQRSKESSTSLSSILSMSQISSFLGPNVPQDLLREAAAERDPNMLTIENTGPGAFTRVTMGKLCTVSKRDRGKVGRVVLFPPSYFYPLPNTQSPDARKWVTSEYIRERVKEDSRILKGITRAVHLWARSWQK